MAGIQERTPTHAERRYIKSMTHALYRMLLSTSVRLHGYKGVGVPPNTVPVIRLRKDYSVVRCWGIPLSVQHYTTIIYWGTIIRMLSPRLRPNGWAFQIGIYTVSATQYIHFILAAVNDASVAENEDMFSEISVPIDS